MGMEHCPPSTRGKQCITWTLQLYYSLLYRTDVRCTNQVALSEASMIYRPDDLHAKLAALAHGLDTPTLYRRGDIVEAEPAVPGW